MCHNALFIGEPIALVRLMERVAATNEIEVLDRVLDKGVVVDAWMSLSVAGIDLLSIEAHVVVASIQTHLKYADELKRLRPNLAAPRLRTYE